MYFDVNRFIYADCCILLWFCVILFSKIPQVGDTSVSNSFELNRGLKPLLEICFNVSQRFHVTQMSNVNICFSVTFGGDVSVDSIEMKSNYN